MISDWSDFFLQLLWSYRIYRISKKLISFHLNFGDNLENMELLVN
jgi:hypothetical protein